MFHNTTKFSTYLRSAEIDKIKIIKRKAEIAVKEIQM